MTRMSVSSSLPMLCSLMLAACGLQVDEGGLEPNEDGETGTVQNPIVEGHELLMSDSEQSGMVQIVDRNTGAGACTSTLLNNTWLLTAGHCFNGGEAQADGTISRHFVEKYAFHFGNNIESGPAGPFNPTYRLASMILKHPGGGFGVDANGYAIGFDIALVKLASPAPSSALPAAHYPNGRMRLYAGTSQSMVGKTVAAYGYGKNVGPNGAPPWDSVGILRLGWLDVYGASYWGISLESPQGTGRYLTNNGDSGGPSFIDTYTSSGTLLSRELVSVHSSSTGDMGASSRAYDTHAQFFADFIRTAIDEGQHPTEAFPGYGFKVRLQHSRKCLDIGGGSTQSGAAVTQWSCHGNPNQRVSLIDMGSGYYSAQFGHSGQCMEVKDGSTANNAPIVQRPCNGSDRQLFQLDNWRSNLEDFWSLGGRSRLRWKHSSKCADLGGANTSNGAALVQYTCHMNTNQQLAFLK